VKLTIRTCAGCEPEDLDRNRRRSPDLPPPSGGVPLAIVGGGASVLDHLDALRDWPGDVWAVNQTAAWCRDNGVSCWFYSVDPNPELAAYVSGRAVLADTCHADTFAATDGARKVTGPAPGPTSAVAAGYYAIKYDFTGATFFGCDSSYGAATHVYRDEPVADMARVECGGRAYLTKLELISQAEQIASLVRSFPAYFTAASGGFLGALLEHGDHDVTHVSRNIARQIEASHADQ
jgi:hypothetical protein